MELTLLQENLARALTFVGKTLSTKTQLPVLSNVLLETDNGRLKLSSTNLETSVSFWVGATIEEEGSISVPGRLFTELVNGFSQDKIQLRLDKTVLQLHCGESQATLSGMDASEFPALPQLPEKQEVKISKTLLDETLSFMMIAASTDEGRPLLTGIRLTNDAVGSWFVATDGYRLSLRRVAQIKGLEEGIVLSAKTLGEAYKLLVEQKIDELGIGFSKDKNQVVFSYPNALLATRLIEGEYPPYSKIIPQSHTTRAMCLKADLLRSVKLAAIFAKESSNIIKLSIGVDKIVVSANSPQIGENNTTLEAKVEGEAVEVAFNSRFLLDLLGVFPRDEVVFESAGSLTAGVFKVSGDDSYLHIIMPVRVQE